MRADGVLAKRAAVRVGKDGLETIFTALLERLQPNAAYMRLFQERWDRKGLRGHEVLKECWGLPVPLDQTVQRDHGGQKDHPLNVGPEPRDVHLPGLPDVEDEADGLWSWTIVRRTKFRAPADPRVYKGAIRSEQNRNPG